MLNVALFGETAKQWRDANPNARGNIRDHALIEQLAVLTNLESLNSVFIRQGLASADRLTTLNEIAITQMRSLLASDRIKRRDRPLKRRSSTSSKIFQSIENSSRRFNRGIFHDPSCAALPL